jgi:hypothetical protein
MALITTQAIMLDTLPTWYRGNMLKTTLIALIGINLFTYLYFTEVSLVQKGQKRMLEFENKVEFKPNLNLANINIV